MVNDNSTGTRNDDLDVEFVPDQTVEDRFIGATADDRAIEPAADKPRGAREAVRAEAGKLGTQATDRLRAFADDGKSRATGALDNIAQLIDDAATQIEDKVGAQYGGYARQASTAVSDLSGKLRDKEIDDLLDDAREFVRKSPGVAIGVAAAAGFVLARVLRSGIDNRNA